MSKQNNAQKKKSANYVKKLTTAGVLCALSVVLMATVRFSIFPQAPFYEMEFSDIPILVCANLLGPVYALVSLLVVCTIQALTVSATSGFIGFVMHLLSSGLMILVVWIIRRLVKGIKGVILSDVLGVIVLIIVMIPMNMWMVSEFMGMSVNGFINSVFLPICIAFNAIKASTNLIIFSLIEKQVSKIYKKIR